MATKSKTTTEKKVFSLLDLIGKKPILVIKQTETKIETDIDNKVSKSEKVNTFEVTLESR